MKHRMLRINEVVKRELSGIVGRELSFEGSLVSINHVDVTSDLKNAHVFVSVLGTEAGESVISNSRLIGLCYKRNLLVTSR